MERVTNIQSAISVISEIQKIIKDKEESKIFGFVFEINHKNELILTVKNKYYLVLNDKNKVKVEKIFRGTDIISTVNDFISFFIEGGEGEITIYENGCHFRCRFCFSENKWAISDVHNSLRYCNHFSCE